MCKSHTRNKYIYDIINYDLYTIKTFLFAYGKMLTLYGVSNSDTWYGGKTQ